MRFSFNEKVRLDIIRTFNMLAHIGGLAELGVVGYDTWTHPGYGYSGLMATVGYILVCKSIAWLVMSVEED